MGYVCVIWSGEFVRIRKFFGAVESTGPSPKIWSEGGFVRGCRRRAQLTRGATNRYVSRALGSDSGTPVPAACNTFGRSRRMRQERRLVAVCLISLPSPTEHPLRYRDVQGCNGNGGKMPFGAWQITVIGARCRRPQRHVAMAVQVLGKNLPVCVRDQQQGNSVSSADLALGHCCQRMIQAVVNMRFEGGSCLGGITGKGSFEHHAVLVHRNLSAIRQKQYLVA